MWLSPAAIPLFVHSSLLLGLELPRSAARRQAKPVRPLAKPGEPSHLQRLSSHGVAFRSFTEEHLSTENELVRNVLLAVLVSLAKLEREKISQRTKAGLERARAKGKVLGRPKFSDGEREKLRMALDAGDSWHAVSKKTRMPYATVKKHARAMGYEPQRRPPAVR